MKIASLFMAAAFLAISATGSKAAIVGADTLPSAAALIQKNVVARGGAAAWQHVSTIVLEGKMDVGKGLQVPYTMDLKRGRKVRVEIVFQGKTAVQVYNGVQGWKIRPFLGHADAEPFTAEEMKKASLDSDIDGLLIDYAAKGTRAEVESKELVEGQPAYKLKLTLKDGQIRHVWLNEQTFLECKLDGTRHMDGKEKSVATYIRDYRTVDGIRVPFTYETSVDGVKQNGSITVSNVRVNEDLNDRLFSSVK